MEALENYPNLALSGTTPNPAQAETAPLADQAGAKLCAFCGGAKLRFELEEIDGWIAHVECLDCDDMIGPMSEYKYDDKSEAEKDAATARNRRVDLAARSAREGQPITMSHRNYRGEVADRTATPKRICWGSTDWHPEPRWLMTAYDPNKQADRDFALADADFRRVAPSASAEVIDAQAVAEAMEDDDGRWKACDGCYETRDGHPVGNYLYSEALKCDLGGGCRECDGLGAIWDTTDYADLGDRLAGGQ